MSDTFKVLPPSCSYCGKNCPPDECAVVFTPIVDCKHKNAEDGCCSHPKNMTPECHVYACPRLHPKIAAACDKAWEATP